MRVVTCRGALRPAGSALALAAVLAMTGCEDVMEPVVEDASGVVAEETSSSVGAPAGVLEVALGAETLALWPYTGTDVAGAISDPINLFFPGRDARDVRAVLMALNGDRTAFGMPPVAPFNCTWSDAIGANQTSFTSGHGWQGSAIQLECGDYAPMRFHLRLFDAGSGAVGNAHFEVIIPGTNQHEVLSWELAEQLLTVDLIRSGALIAPPSVSGLINPAPTFKTINPLIYNGLPVALRGAIGGPLGNQAAPVPIPSNGRATVLALGAVAPAPVMDVTEHTVLNFGQVIPKPFCAGPGDFVHVAGPVDFEQRIVVDASGAYRSTFAAQGTLQVTPVNPLTGQPLGPTYTAQVKAEYNSGIDDDGSFASNYDRQVLRLDAGAVQRFVGQMRAGSGSDYANVAVTCS